MLQHASHTYTFFTKQQEQGQSEGVGTWFLLICKAWQMDICKLSIKISGTSDRSHPTRWSYVILKSNDLRISSQLILCLALLTVSTFHLQAGLSLKPTTSLIIDGDLLVGSLSLSIRATGPLEANCSCRSLVLCFLYALRKGALVCRSVPGPLSLALLPDSDVPLPSWVGRWARGRARLGEGDRLYCDYIQNTRRIPCWPGRSATLFTLKKMPMICGVNDPSEKPLTRKKPQGGKQTKV